jgi:ribonuclease HII
VFAPLIIKIIYNTDVQTKYLKYIIGIDEVGRGPLAGPVAVGAFKMPVDFNTKGFGKIRDSKKLKPEQREEITEKLKILKKGKIVDYFVCYESAKKIDKVGLSKAIKNCLEKSLAKLKVIPKECLVLLDGGLKAPDKFKNQKTIIKGDEKERAIAFASIVAKVSRDALMCKLAKKYPEYCFEIHKGYGTKMHRNLIEKHGLCIEHRRLFCRNFDSNVLIDNNV